MNNERKRKEESKMNETKTGDIRDRKEVKWKKKVKERKQERKE